MSTQETRERLELLQGTMDPLILRTLIFGPQHGQGIARAIQQISEEELLVEHGALYPALQRLEEHGWISGKWGTSSNNRKARFYPLTAAGRKALVQETAREACGGSHRADTRPRKGGLVQCSDGSGRQATLAPKLKHTYSRRARACENRG